MAVEQHYEMIGTTVNCSLQSHQLVVLVHN